MGFTDPFPGLDRHLNSQGDQVRALRLDIALEQDAASVYTNQADHTDNIMLKTMLNEVADDERTHIGVFQRMVEVLTEDENELNLKGAQEVEQKFPNLRYSPNKL